MAKSFTESFTAEQQSCPKWPFFKQQKQYPLFLTIKLLSCIACVAVMRMYLKNDQCWQKQQDTVESPWATVALESSSAGMHPILVELF